MITLGNEIDQPLCDYSHNAPTNLGPFQSKSKAQIKPLYLSIKNWYCFITLGCHNYLSKNGKEF